MLQVNLNANQQRQLARLLHREKDMRTWRRLRALKLRSQQVKPKEIARMFGVRRETVTYWMNLFLQGGFPALTTLNYQGSVSVLEPYKQGIEKLIKTQKVPTLSVLQQQVNKEFGVEIGETGLYKWCKKKLMLPLRRPE